MQVHNVEQLYAAADISKIWTVSEVTLKQAIKSGELMGFYDNGKFVTKAKNINQWLDKRIEVASHPTNQNETRGRKSKDTSWVDKIKVN